MDTTGASRQLKFRDVIFVPEMKVDLLPLFNRTRCTCFVSKDYKIHVELAADMDLFQLQAKTQHQPLPNVPVAITRAFVLHNN
ncbi:hypothetical protein PHPALM_30591 [Phytophthora palmivora]|uniref:Uncharacterized protein n=1 Tax=Phytophthora palmivora TaxID=4796 RepID=A0A2P4X4Q7_9STRA|nr:hypothetical protein PHPALM_30591 [Phytophthora palmivora]